ncbi:gas vesicle protein GvpFL [Parafrankia colletiae]|uniref:Gas vesicle protein GvpFL n=1 Tax=Parafrankia colletiae TaxID=573497 RepID=A0A1S1QSX5_9ACTN|nr:GvpL/GvpF family gas vesicle protein [Parafrankia colletiae]MCK9904328.1 GvpL/GvpF family gas vesicle protein [Frankia sp. Cpl3]OHV36686.1 gas vesicle protein GvpFL [Parafrankia colletiae]
MTVAPADADFSGLDELAARLAPGVMAEAVAEAREVARAQLAQLLAREITRAACDQRGSTTTWSLPPAPELREHRSDPGPPARQPAPERRERHRAGRGGPAATDRDAGPAGRAGRSPGGIEQARVLYAYGIVPSDTEVAGLPGLAEGTDVRAVTRGCVSLVVSAIDPDLLRDVEEDLSETGRLAALARGHDQVLRELQDRAGVLPLRFGTVLPGEDEAAAVLDDPDHELPRALEALHGAREWGFRIDTVGEAEASTSAAPAAGADGTTTTAGAGGTAGAGAGTAYLAARRDELHEEERRRDEAARLVERTHRELLAHARDAARRPGRPDRVFDGAYLVERDEEERFLDAAERLGPPLEEVGYLCAVSGPWPPYSFVHLTLGGDGQVDSVHGTESAVPGSAARRGPGDQCGPGDQIGSGEESG